MLKKIMLVLVVLIVSVFAEKTSLLSVVYIYKVPPPHVVFSELQSYGRLDTLDYIMWFDVDGKKGWRWQKGDSTGMYLYPEYRVELIKRISISELRFKKQSLEIRELPQSDLETTKIFTVPADSVLSEIRGWNVWSGGERKFYSRKIYAVNY